MQPTNPATGSNAQTLTVVPTRHASAHPSRRSSVAEPDDFQPPATLESVDSMRQLRDRTESTRGRRSHLESITDFELEPLRMQQRQEQCQHELELARLQLQIAQTQSSNAAGTASNSSPVTTDRSSRRFWRAELFASGMNEMNSVEGTEDFIQWSFRVYQAALDAEIAGHFVYSIPRPDESTPV